MMSTGIFQACKKRILRTPTKYNIQRVSQTYPFHDLNGPFRENIRWFIQNCCELEDYYVAGNPTWSTLLVTDETGVVFPLYTVEEDVFYSKNPLCDVCRFVGWGNHFVAKRRYHFIIPRECDWNKALDSKSLDCDDHILHGMIHCNGFGHLLTLHGGDMDSNVIPPTELMDLWDCLCTTLRTRKITVHDVFLTCSMELRLIHGVAHRSSWFGRWGYKFCGGSFGVTERKYKRATQVLSFLDLDRITSDFGRSESGLVIQHIIQVYRAASNTRLLTIGDLFEYMLDFKGKPIVQKKAAIKIATGNSGSSSELPNNGNKSRYQKNNSVGHEKFEAIAAKSDCRWPARRLEHAANVIADILEENKLATQSVGMSRHDLRESARQHIGDTGLIDYVLKTIGDKVVGRNVIRRVSNPATKTLEFSIEKVEEFAEQEADPFEPGLDVCEDMLYICKNVLLGYPEDSPVSLAAGTVLNSKYFVKEWNISVHLPDDVVLAVCQIMPSYKELETILTQDLPPEEVILLPRSGKSAELKLQAEVALRDTYFLTRNFVVKDIKINGSQSDGDEVLECWVRGSGLDMKTQLRYEGNASDGGEVNCDCGAMDDDGERMVRCDMCNVWQHTSCNDIEDDEVPPTLFLCRKCEKVKWDNQGRRSGGVVSWT